MTTGSMPMGRDSEVRQSLDDTDGSIRRRHLPGLSVSILAALAWTVLAWRTPTSTHHFAPLVAGGAWSYVLRQGSVKQTRNDRVLAAIGGVSIGLVAFAVLDLSDKLLGPPLLAAVPVRAELPIMAALGGIIGNGLRRRGGTTGADPPSR